MAGAALAYNDQTTHPALTQEIVDLYNALHPSSSISAEEKEWIISGSILEDTIPRMINHFYDPVRNTGWTGANAGTVSPETMQRTSSALVSWEKPLSAVEWAVNYGIQQSYGPYGGNRSWKRGLEYFAEDDREEAFITLGHTLHLVEDMGVPDHTRDDSHIDAVARATGDPGSPYEKYASHWTRESIKELNLVDGLKNAGIPRSNSVEDYLKRLAEYSNKYFFSKDTVNDPKYQFPKIVREDGRLGYGTDEIGGEFILVKVRQKWNDESQRFDKSYELLGDPDNRPIFDAYFSRLSSQVVLHGVGVVELFLRQAEDEKVNLEYRKAADPFGYGIFRPLAKATTLPNVSFAGLGAKMFSFADGAIANVRNATAVVAKPVANLIARFVQTEPVELPPLPAGDAVFVDDVALSGGSTQLVPVETAALPQTENIPAADELTLESPPVSAAPADDFIRLAPPQPQSLEEMQGEINRITRQVALLQRQVNNASRLASDAPSAVEDEENEEENDENLTNSAGQAARTSVPAVVFPGGGGGGGGGASVVSTPESSPPTPPPPPTPTSTVSNVGHILISEIQVAGADAGDEFVELYNPTDGDVDISTWSIQYLSGIATSTEQASRKNFETGNTIPARGYFLIARALDAGADGYRGGVVPDMSHRTFSLSGASNGATVFLVSDRNPIAGADDPDIADRIAYGSGAGLLPESAAAVLPPDSQSLERKAWREGACLTAASANEFLGNGCDAGDNASDFETRTTPHPQNRASLPETRSAPAISNFAASYSSSTMSAEFSWDLSADARGATSTNLYTILRFSTSTPTSTTQLFRASSTQAASVPVDQEYLFEFRAEDGENSYNSTTTRVTSSFFSYLGTVFEQSQNTGDLMVAAPNGSHYFAQTFTPQRTGRINRISFPWGGSRIDGASSCSLRLYQAENPLSTSTANLVGSAYWFLDAVNTTEVMSGGNCVSGNYSFATTTISAGTTYTLVFNYSDATHTPFLRGDGDSIPGSYWVDGTEYRNQDIRFAVSGIVMSSLAFTGVPAEPANLQFDFDRFHSRLNLSWDASADPDTLTEAIEYLVNHTTSTELSLGGWQSVGSSTTASVPLVFPNTYKVGVKARDNFYNTSTSTVRDWNFPAGFTWLDNLVSQTDVTVNVGANSQNGNKVNQYAQTFTVTTSSIPYTVKLNTGSTTGGSCSVKIYAAGSIGEANSGNLAAASDNLSGSDCNAAVAKTFRFTSTSVLNPGTTYIWIYTAARGVSLVDTIAGGYRAEGYPGVFSTRQTGDGPEVNTTLSQEYSAYFELSGDLVE